MSLSPLDEQQQEFQREVISEATDEGLCMCADAITACICYLRGIVEQLGGGTGIVIKQDRTHGKALAQLVVESLANEPPCKPADLVHDFDPDGALPNDEYAIDAVRERLANALAAVKYEE